MSEQRHRVVIIGGGFGGLHAAKSLARATVDVTLVDRRNFHLFQPLLYQVASGALNAGDIAAPIRRALRRQRNTRVIMGEVTDIDPGRCRIIVDGDTMEYDSLVIAAGVLVRPPGVGGRRAGTEDHRGCRRNPAPRAGRL